MANCETGMVSSKMIIFVENDEFGLTSPQISGLFRFLSAGPVFPLFCHKKAGLYSYFARK